MTTYISGIPDILKTLQSIDKTLKDMNRNYLLVNKVTPEDMIESDWHDSDA